MAKKRRRKYSRGSGEEVRREMHRYKRGRAKSGRGGKGGKVKSRKQAIAIALSKARKKGDCAFQGTQERKESSTKEALRAFSTPRAPIDHSVNGNFTWRF
jgi:hypothetical protein